MKPIKSTDAWMITPLGQRMLSNIPSRPIGRRAKRKPRDRTVGEN